MALRAVIALGLAGWLMPGVSVAFEEDAPSEYQIKAAFLFNFAKFVEWPATAFKNAGDPIALCTLGQNPFGFLLEDAVRGKVVGNRSFVVREVSNAPQASKCQILLYPLRSEKACARSWKRSRA